MRLLGHQSPCYIAKDALDDFFTAHLNDARADLNGCLVAVAMHDAKVSRKRLAAGESIIKQFPAAIGIIVGIKQGEVLSDELFSGKAGELLDFPVNFKHGTGIDVSNDDTVVGMQHQHAVFFL